MKNKFSTFLKIVIPIALATVILYYGFTSHHVDNIGHVGGLIAGILLALVIYAIPCWIKKLKNHAEFLI